ncbi:AFG2-interacting ribosome maturation factor [Salminus brasiliensis]|uniref:AFG2-interacting ribosome maturation factor n=1 Tax=Salminus brasiliensis TaxID=930266 RepID=UPI003B8331A1
MSHPALLMLHQELRKCFQSLKTNRDVWRSALEECSPLMSSLGNLAEQLRALKSVELVNTPLSQFPDLQQRLQHKLAQAVDTVLSKLSEKMDSLQGVRDSISKQVFAVFQLYDQNTAALDLRSCVSRSATSPSIADMLEWLQDAECYYRVQYIQRKNLLWMLKPDDLTLLEAAPKRWASLDSPSREERISDALFHVSFFMELE